MEATTLSRTPPRSGPVEVGLVASLLVLAAGAWAVTGDRMGGMDAGPGTELGGLGWFVVVWVTMMAAMMLPSIAPMVLAYARISDRGRPRPSSPATSSLGRPSARSATRSSRGSASLDLGVLAWDEAGRYVAGGAILAAAVVSAQPAEDRSLRRCRDPRAFVSEHWRRGPVGALRMGIEHGRVCVGLLAGR